jgi:isopentenyl-diphosphate Delta-isomerase
MESTKQVILVNENDEMIGTMDKMDAHRAPHLHRAFSIFIFNSNDQLLLQKRNSSKYHSGGLWTNACCSHPSPGEDIKNAAQNRLVEEMGFSTAIKEAFHFTYQHRFDNGLYEHEYDHVFVCIYDGEVNPDPEEVEDHCYKSFDEIRTSIESHPSKYTVWFVIAFPMIEQWFERKNSIKL